MGRLAINDHSPDRNPGYGDGAGAKSVFVSDGSRDVMIESSKNQTIVWVGDAIFDAIVSRVHLSKYGLSNCMRTIGH